jgi:hypothetical protein
MPKFTQADVDAQIADGADHRERTYELVRMYHPSLQRRARRLPGGDGLTLAEARAHCQREDTRKDGEWFDGYQHMGRGRR